MLNITPKIATLSRMSLNKLVTTALLVILPRFREVLGGFPYLSLRRPSRPAVESYLARLSLLQVPFNHDFAHLLCDPLCNLPGAPFVINHRRVVVGSGQRDFDIASQLLLDFSFINAETLTWAEVVVLPGTLQSSTRRVRLGEVIGTLVRCGWLIWVLSPCRVTCVSCDVEHTTNMRVQTSGATIPPLRSAMVGFSTVKGHLLAGEERFRVELVPVPGSSTEEVVLDMLSFSRGDGWLGWLVFPVVRGIQRAFFRAIERSFLALMKQLR